MINRLASAYQKLSRLAQKKAFLSSLIINGLFFLLCFASRVILMQIDDRYTSFFSFNVFGEYNGFLPYNNMILGHLVVFLNKHIGSVSWYMLFQVFFTFIAYTLLTFVMLKHLKKGRLLFIAFLLYSLNYKLVKLFQFTPVAMNCMAFGLIVIFYYMLWGYKEKKEMKIALPLAAMLIFYGYLLRSETIIPIIASGLIFFICAMVKTKKGAGFTEFFKLRKTAILFLLVVCVLVLSVFAVDYAYYSTDPLLINSKEMGKAIPSYYDYPKPTYTENPELYESAGLSENDTMIANKLYFTTPGLTAEKYNKIAQYRKENLNFFIKSSFASLKSFLTTRANMYIYLFFIFFLMFFVIDKKNFLWYLIFLFTVLGYIALLSINGRVKERVVSSVIEMMILFSLLWYSLYGRQRVEASIKSFSALALILCFTAFGMLDVYTFASGIITARRHYRKPRPVSEVTSYVNDNKDITFIGTRQLTSDYSFLFDFFDVPPANYLENLVTVGDRFTMMPNIIKAAEELNAGQPFELLLDSDKALFICLTEDTDMFTAYIKEHCTTDFTSKEIKTIDRYSVIDFDRTE